MSTIIKKDATFIETECRISLSGKEYESGGSYLLKRKDNGRLEGILYAYPKEKNVGSWDGSLKIPAVFGRPFLTNFGVRRQHLWFSYLGHKFIGTNYSLDWQDIVRVKELTIA